VTAVLWDLDGTLVDTASDLSAAIDRMLADSGLAPLGEATVRRFIGHGARNLVDRCVREAGGEPGPDHLAAFLARYREGLCVLSRPYPGIPALVRELRCQAVVTNKPEGLSRALLDALDLEIPVVVGGDTLAVRKPSPAPVRRALELLGVATGVMVGDGEPDVQAGRAAGLRVIGVGWGIATPAGADRLVRSVTELRAALREESVSVGAG
jgi:phosphoglycolate phosphatase